MVRTKRSELIGWALSLVIGLGVLLPATAAKSQGTVLVVVVNESVDLTDVTLSRLRWIYSGESHQWADGEKVFAINLRPGTPERSAFDRLVLGMDQDATKNYWVDRTIRGQSRPPKTASSVLFAQRVVSAKKGAIGYVRADQLTGRARVLTVDGKAHTDPGYPLKVDVAD